MIDLQIKLEQYHTFAEIVRAAADLYGDQTFVVQGEARYSFREVDELVDKTAGYLMAAGVGENDVVTIILENSIEYLLLYFAASRIGAVINPLPFHLSNAEIAEKLEFVEARIVITEGKHYQELSARTDSVVEVSSDFIDTVRARERPPAMPRVKADTVGYLYYSSGTTGLPKLIEYTHQSELVTMASQLRSNFSHCLGPHLCFLPLGHTAAIRYSLLPCLIAGQPLVLYKSFWKLRSRLWDEVALHQATYFQMVPSILNMMVNTKYPDYDREKVACLRYIGCGSSVLPVVLQQRCQERFGLRVANLYGLSETGPTHFDDPLAEGWQPGSIGYPLDIMEVRLFDEEGGKTPLGTSGEIAVKGPSLLKGYYRAEELYRDCFRDGFFMTGDLGRIDTSGRYFYVDRKKDLIIKGGINIAPGQIEAVLAELPEVAETAVVATPDPFLGENIKAFIVVTGDAEFDAEAARRHCLEKLGEFKTPSVFETIEELPKGPSGKILKRILQERE